MPGRALSVLEKPAELSDHDQSLAGRVLPVLSIGTTLKLPVGVRQEPLDVPTRIEFAHAVSGYHPSRKAARAANYAGTA